MDREQVAALGLNTPLDTIERLRSIRDNTCAWPLLLASQQWAIIDAIDTLEKIGSVPVPTQEHAVDRAGALRHDHPDKLALSSSRAAPDFCANEVEVGSGKGGYPCPQPKGHAGPCGTGYISSSRAGAREQENARLDIDTDLLRAALKWFDEHTQIASTSTEGALDNERQRAIHRITLVQTINLIDIYQRDPSSSARVEQIEEKASSWLPIESAPKDGTQILIWIVGIEPRPRIAYWADRGLEYGWFGLQSQHYIGVPVTHWMPLPAPPEAQ